MRFPEWLYRLLPGDAGSQQLGVIWREAETSQVATTVGTTIYAVPSDKCLVLTNSTMRFRPLDAGTTTNRRRLLADPPSGTTRYNIFDEEAGGAAGVVLSNNWQGEVVIPGGWKVRVEADFGAAGVLGNEVGAELHGYLIPRGTFVFG